MEKYMTTGSGQELKLIQTIEPEILLSDEQKQELLNQCEDTINKNLKNVIEFSQALYIIKSNALYKLNGFKTFTEYCFKKWSLSRRYINNHIQDYVAIEPIKNEVGAIAPELNESHLRALLEAPTPELRLEVIKELIEKKIPLTATKIKETIKEKLPPIKSVSTSDNTVPDNNKKNRVPDKIKLLLKYEQIIKNNISLTSCSSVHQIKLLQEKMNGLFDDLLEEYYKINQPEKILDNKLLSNVPNEYRNFEQFEQEFIDYMQKCDKIGKSKDPEIRKKNSERGANKTRNTPFHTICDKLPEKIKEEFNACFRRGCWSTVIAKDWEDLYKITDAEHLSISLYNLLKSKNP